MSAFDDWWQRDFSGFSEGFACRDSWDAAVTFCVGECIRQSNSNALTHIEKYRAMFIANQLRELFLITKKEEEQHRFADFETIKELCRKDGEIIALKNEIAELKLKRV